MKEGIFILVHWRDAYSGEGDYTEYPGPCELLRGGWFREVVDGALIITHELYTSDPGKTRDCFSVPLTNIISIWELGRKKQLYPKPRKKR